MPIYIPDRIKAPGDFPTLDANDNQIRGFGFFDDATERSALKSTLRCQGYLAFMKDTTQFKQYDSASEADADWENDSNWVLIEGQQTDTYWAADADGAGIYYSNQVIVSASTYNGTEQFYVNGDAKISGALEATTSVKTPIVQSDTSLVLGIDALEAGSPSDLTLEWKYGTTRFFSASPYNATAPNFVFGNQLKDWDFKFQTISANADVVHDVPSGVNPGFQFKGAVDSVDVSGKFVANLTDGNPRFSFDNDLRKIIFAPEGYKISTTVDADVNVLNGVEILLPDPDTGDMHFKNIAQKNFLFSTNTGSGSPTEILEMKPDLVVSNVRLAVGLTSADYANLEVTSRALVDIGTNSLPYWAYSIRNSADNVIGALGLSAYNNILIGGFNNGAVSIATHVGDGTLDTEVVAHFNSTGVGIGTTDPDYKLDVYGNSNFVGSINVGTPDTALAGVYLRRTDGNLMGGIRTNDNSNVIIGGFNNNTVQIAKHVADGTLDDEVIAHFSINGVGIGTTSPSQKLHVVGSMYLLDNTTDNNTLIGTGWSTLTGKFNTALGGGALSSVTATGFTVAIGYEAGKNSGSNSVAIGYRAESNTDDVVIGHESGNDAGGNSNVIVGRRAGQKAGGTSVLIGHEAGRYAFGNNNTVLGYQAYKGVDGVSNESNTTAIGFQALMSLTTGAGNTAVGYKALASATTKGSNTAVGYLALENMDESGQNGQYVTAVGLEAGQNLVAAQSTVIGYRAGKNAQGAITALGYQAGISASGGTYLGYGAASGSTTNATTVGQENYRNVTSGGGDVAIGSQVMWSAKTAKATGSNVMIGNGASYYAGTDTSNIVIGSHALRGTEQGAAAGYLDRDYNVAIGYRAMYRAYSGADNNIVIGYQAGYSQQLATDAGDLSTVTFANNVFIGYQSAYDITSGTRNVAIGELSAFELTEGSRNVLLGYGAGLNLTTGSDNVLLGYGAGGQLTTESNKLYIANSNTTTPLIYGDFSLGNVGIGETSPDTKLHITDSKTTSKLLTLENVADANWGGGLILKWANADGTNPYSLDIGAYNQSNRQMRLKFTNLSERVSFTGAPGYQFDKEVIPGSGAGDGGIASNYHQHLYFRLRSNNGNNGYDPTNMYFKAEGGTGTTNISGNLMIMKGDGDIEVPNGDLEISDNSNGLILKDTVTSTRYRVQITSGAIAISPA